MITTALAFEIEIRPPEYRGWLFWPETQSVTVPTIANGNVIHCLTSENETVCPAFRSHGDYVFYPTAYGIRWFDPNVLTCKTCIAMIKTAARKLADFGDDPESYLVKADFCEEAGETAEANLLRVAAELI